MALNKIISFKKELSTLIITFLEDLKIKFNDFDILNHNFSYNTEVNGLYVIFYIQNTNINNHLQGFSQFEELVNFSLEIVSINSDATIGVNNLYTMEERILGYFFSDYLIQFYTPDFESIPLKQKFRYLGGEFQYQETNQTSLYSFSYAMKFRIIRNFIPLDFTIGEDYSGLESLENEKD